ncbi:MAG: tetratricopeptide repeat protein [Ramlibacter sp.]
MASIRPIFRRNLRALAVLVALAAPAFAQADEYGDVTQLLRQGKQADALAKADQFLGGKPRDPQMRFLRGVILTEQGKTSDAIATFTKLTEDYPELPEPYNNLAVLYAGQSQFDKARAALEMAIRINPSYATAHENLGDVYAKLASQAYSRALQLDAGNTAVQPKLALIRELFAPGARGARPGAAAATPAPVQAAPRTAPNVVAKAPAPVAAGPVPAVAAKAPAPAATPTAAVAAKAPAPVPAPTPAPAVVAKAPAAVAPSTSPAPVAAAALPVPAASTAHEVESAVQAWAAAWSSKDVPGYLAAYGKDFDPPGKQSRKAWEEERRNRILGKSKINVKVSDLAVSVAGTKATVKFRQAYSADSLNVTSRKTLDLQKVGERWTIVRESAGA